MSIDWRTPLVELDTPRDAIGFRKVIVANAIACIGLSAGIAETYKAFERLLGRPYKGIPWDLRRPFKAWKENGVLHTQGVSTCGLVGEGIEKRSGFANPWLSLEYYPAQPYQSITRSVAWGGRVGAWIDGRKQNDLFPRPESGSQVIIGCRSPYEESSGSEHALTVIGWEDDVVVNVAGGKVDCDHGFLQCVKLVRLRWVLRSGKVWLVAPDAPPHLASGRRLHGWLSPSLVPQTDRCMAPVGWEDVEVEL